MIIGVGVDIQEIQKIEEAIDRTGERFLAKLFTPNEREYCEKQIRSAQHFTGRFCAKEAFFKAMGTGWAQGLKWHEVEVRHVASGRPEFKLEGMAARLSEQAGIRQIWLSISHSEAYATAVVVLEG